MKNIMDKIYKWHIHSTSNEGIWLQKKSKGIKSAKLAIFMVALLKPCTKFEFFVVKNLHLKCYEFANM